MNYKYVVMETVYHNGAHTRKVYGIAVISTLDNISVLHEIADITDNREELENVVNLCNSENLDIGHLENVVDDLLCVIK